MTTLAVDDELYHLAREAAAAQGKTVDEFVGNVLREVLAAPRVEETRRNGLPVMVPRAPVPSIDPAMIRRHVEEDGF